MKILICLIIELSIFPVSIISMIYGWGIEPQSWGWILFGYVWIVLTQVMVKAARDE